MICFITLYCNRGLAVFYISTSSQTPTKFTIAVVKFATTACRLILGVEGEGIVVGGEVERVVLGASVTASKGLVRHLFDFCFLVGLGDGVQRHLLANIQSLHGVKLTVTGVAWLTCFGRPKSRKGGH